MSTHQITTVSSQDRGLIGSTMIKKFFMFYDHHIQCEADGIKKYFKEIDIFQIYNNINEIRDLLNNSVEYSNDETHLSLRHFIKEIYNYYFTKGGDNQFSNNTTRNDIVKLIVEKTGNKNYSAFLKNMSVNSRFTQHNIPPHLVSFVEKLNEQIFHIKEIKIDSKKLMDSIEIHVITHKTTVSPKINGSEAPVVEVITKKEISQFELLNAITLTYNIITGTTTKSYDISLYNFIGTLTGIFGGVCDYVKYHCLNEIGSCSLKRHIMCYTIFTNKSDDATNKKIESNIKDNYSQELIDLFGQDADIYYVKKYPSLHNMLSYLQPTDPKINERITQFYNKQN